MTTTHKFQNRHGVTLYIRADFAQASSPLAYSWHDDQHMDICPMQVADARHRPLEAARLVSDWCRTNYGC